MQQNKMKILIAEDEVIVAKDLSRILLKLEYEVVGMTKSAKEVIEQAELLKPDIILMDIELDENSSGIEAAYKIKEFLDIPFIYISGLSDNNTINKAKLTEPSGFIVKPFEPRSLYSTIEMSLYKHKVSQKLRERTKELEKEKIKTEDLLKNIYPTAIIKELKETGRVDPKEYRNVTLLYTDFEGFTSIASKMDPDLLITELNDIFKNFDFIVDKYGLEKIKTIGDSYIAACGIPVEDKKHTIKIISAAIEMQDYLFDRNLTSDNKWYMRIGVHTGNVIGGVAGKSKFTFDIWGDSVNIANIMERVSLPGEVNVSGITARIARSYFNFDFYKKVKVPGNETISMYLVRDKKNANLIEQDSLTYYS